MGEATNEETERIAVLGDHGTVYRVTYGPDPRSPGGACWAWQCNCRWRKFHPREACKHIKRARLALGKGEERVMEERGFVEGNMEDEEDLGGIDSHWIIDLKGKKYPQWGGVLDLATRLGLTSLVCDLVQVPSAENGMVAIMSATAVFERGGATRTFRAYGDASPRNVAHHLQEATIRLAETRAKGRALRDACNVGQTMLEELPEEEVRGAPQEERARPAGASVAKPGAAGPPARGSGGMVCSTPNCGRALTKGQYEVSLRAFGQPLCPFCQKAVGRTV